MMMTRYNLKENGPGGFNRQEIGHGRIISQQQCYFLKIKGLPEKKNAGKC